MATHRIPILGAATLPDSSGGVYPLAFDVEAANDQWRHLVWAFGADGVAPTTRLLLYGKFVVPKNYVSAPKAIIVWTAAPTTGDVVWDFDYRTVGGNDTTSLDQSGTEEVLTVTDTAPAATFRRLETSVTLTAANLSVDEEVQFLIARDGVDAADTMADRALLFSLLLEYADV